MDEESRSRTVTNLIRTLSPKIGVQLLPADAMVVTRRPPKPAAADTAGQIGTRLPTTTGSVILRLARRHTAESVLQTQWTGEGTAILDRQGRRCSIRLLGAPHLDDIERPVRQVWLRSPSFRGLTEADMWLRLAEGLLPSYEQHQPCEAAADQPAAAPADVMALAGVRAWAEYEADTDADDAVICPPTRTLLAFLKSHGRAVIQVTVEHCQDREDQPTAPLPGVLPPALSKQFFRCALAAKAVCSGPLASLELPTVEQLAEAIAASISQRTNTPPELHHAQRLTDTMTTAGVEMRHYHTEPTLLRVRDEHLCAISLGKEDEEFADTLRLAVALTSPVALLRAIRLRTIVIYLTESEFDPSELLIHPFSQTIREAGELGGNTCHNRIRRAAIGIRKKVRKTAAASLALRATGRPIYTLTMQLTAHHQSIIGGTRSTGRTEPWRKTMSTACGKIKAAPAPAPAERRPADTSPAPPPADPIALPLPATPAAQTAPLVRDAPPPGLEHVPPRRGAVADAVAAIDQRGVATERAPGAGPPAHAPTATAPAATTMPGTQADEEEELELNYEENDMEVDTTQGAAAETPGLADISLGSPQRSTVHRTFMEGTRNGSTERLAELHHLTTTATELLAQSSPASQPALAANLASLATETHQLRNPKRLSIQLERHPSQPTPAGKGKAATTAKHNKKQPMCRSRPDGATRNRSMSKPRLSGAHGSDCE
eukprot:jgi/Tetstr1/431049/TSEL_020766.t1